MKTILITIVLSLFASTCNAQTFADWYSNKSAAMNAQRAAQAARNQAKQIRRMRKNYSTQLKNNEEIRSESDLLFGDTRTWKAGIYSAQARLCSFKQGKVSLVVSNGAVIAESFNKFCDEDKEWLRMFRKWEKLGGEGRKQWIADYKKKLADEALARHEAAQKFDKARKAIVEQGYNMLAQAYDDFKPGRTTQKEFSDFVGFQPTSKTEERKSMRSDTYTATWDAVNGKNERLVIKVTFENGFASKAEKIIRRK